MAYRACAPTTSDGAINELLRSWGRDISDARQSMGLSLSACADCLFLSPETVQGIENGDPRVGLGAFVTVLWALGLVETLEGPLAPVEREDRPVFLPAVIADHQKAKLPVLFVAPGLPYDEDQGPAGDPRWPSELWALEDRIIIGSKSFHSFIFDRDTSQEADIPDSPEQGEQCYEEPALLPSPMPEPLLSQLPLPEQLLPEPLLFGCSGTTNGVPGLRVQYSASEERDQAEAERPETSALKAEAGRRRRSLQREIDRMRQRMAPPSSPPPTFTERLVRNLRRLLSSSRRGADEAA